MLYEKPRKLATTSSDLPQAFAEGLVDPVQTLDDYDLTSLAGTQSPQETPARFPCPQCDRSFTRKHNLKGHLRSHKDERPFLCTVCGRGFSRQHDCKSHERLHLRKRDFVCRGVLPTGIFWGCGRRFERKTALNRHQQSNKGRRCFPPGRDEENVLLEEAIQRPRSPAPPLLEPSNAAYPLLMASVRDPKVGITGRLDWYTPQQRRAISLGLQRLSSITDVKE